MRHWLKIMFLSIYFSFQLFKLIDVCYKKKLMVQFNYSYPTFSLHLDSTNSISEKKIVCAVLHYIKLLITSKHHFLKITIFYVPISECIGQRIFNQNQITFVY